MCARGPRSWRSASALAPPAPRPIRTGTRFPHASPPRANAGAYGCDRRHRPAGARRRHPVDRTTRAEAMRTVRRADSPQIVRTRSPARTRRPDAAAGPCRPWPAATSSRRWMANRHQSIRNSPPTLFPATLQDSTAAASRHSSHESMDSLTLTLFGLERMLHGARRTSRSRTQTGAYYNAVAEGPSTLTTGDSRLVPPDTSG